MIQIYNSTMETGYIIERITTKEKSKLRELTLGYGKLRAAAFRAELHENTLRNVIQKGFGEPDTINKIRVNLLQGNNKSDNQQCAA
jgi:hypothetical protein